MQRTVYTCSILTSMPTDILSVAREIPWDPCMYLGADQLTRPDKIEALNIQLNEFILMRTPEGRAGVFFRFGDRVFGMYDVETFEDGWAVKLKTVLGNRDLRHTILDLISGGYFKDDDDGLLVASDMLPKIFRMAGIAIRINQLTDMLRGR